MNCWRSFNVGGIIYGKGYLIYNVLTYSKILLYYNRTYVRN